MTVVYFDLETAGLELHHPIIQIAAVAVGDSGNIFGTFNEKLQFDEAQATPEALLINHYSAEAWANALPPVFVVGKLIQFLNKYKEVELISRKTGKPYKVARLGGYNCETFDMPRLRKLFKDSNDAFLPAHPKTLDVLQLAMWYWHVNPRRPPVSMKLVNVCEAAGVLFDNTKAHDALYDCYVTAALSHLLQGQLRKNGVPTA